MTALKQLTLAIEYAKIYDGVDVGSKYGWHKMHV